MADTKKIVQLQDENGLFIYPTTTLEAIAGSNTLRENFVQKEGDTMTGPLVSTGFVGPLTGNATSADKLNTDDGGIKNPVYFTNGIPVACTGTTVPTGGNIGQILIKNSANDGDTKWSNDISITGSSGSCTGNSETATKLATARTISLEGDITGSGTFDGSDNLNITTAINHNHDDSYVNITGDTMTGNLTIASSNSRVIANNGTNSLWFGINSGGTTWGLYDVTNEKYIISCNGEKVSSGYPIYGAVWNDYAEYRSQKEIIEPGYCVASTDNGQIYKTTEKFQACDGIVSDTFGFAIGETNECKTPLAVAGRVLAYCEGSRYDYHAGDTVCAGANGKVCKMTREEVREWPDRIVGIVSEIPEYEIWGTGNIKVNNRIWIKIK